MEREAQASQLKSLERRVRILTLVVFCFAAALFTMAASDGRGETVVRARAIDIVDESGSVRIRIGESDGETGLFIRDDSGKLRLSATHQEEQTALFIRDDAETVRIGVAQFAHGGGGFALHGPESKGAAVLYLKGTGSLSFYDPDGNRVHRVPEADPER